MTTAHSMVQRPTHASRRNNIVDISVQLRFDRASLVAKLANVFPIANEACV